MLEFKEFKISYSYR